MIGCMQPIFALYFESENELKFYSLEASSDILTLDLLQKTISNLHLTLQQMKTQNFVASSGNQRGLNATKPVFRDF